MKSLLLFTLVAVLSTLVPSEQKAESASPRE